VDEEKEMSSWIRRHPWLTTIFSFVVVTAPQWIASLWALFSAEPLVSWLLRHNFPRLVFSPWWISGSIGGIFFIVILSVLWRRDVGASAQQPNVISAREELDERDKLMLACADAMARGEKMFWALLEVKADELTENADLVYICDTLSNEGHENQLDVIPKSSWLFVLKKARLRPNRPRNEVELYDFICQLAGLRQSIRSPTTITDNSRDNWKQLEIQALPPSPNNKNLTQLAWNEKGRPPFDAYCILSVRNPNLTQGIDGVAFRLLSIKPELASSRGFDPATSDVDLRKLQFNFTDIPGNTLKGDQTAYVTVFRATRQPIAEESLKILPWSLMGIGRPERGTVSFHNLLTS
jgi:hypothetical protein